jgi:hypothetical protein
MTFPAPTRVGRLSLESRHMPAAQGGGGDIYDVMATPFGVRLLIGDVMGTGLAANQTGLTVLNAWRELACTEPSLAGIAVRLHVLITRSEHPDRFVTALLVNFPVAGQWEEPAAGAADPDPAGGSRAEIVCCGHPPPLLLRGGSAVFIEPYAAPPLGLLDLADGWCKASMIGVGEGDQLLLYTDGVSEARDGAGRFFPLAEQTAMALRASAGAQAATGRPQLLDSLVASLRDHAGDRVTDDIMLLLVTLRLVQLSVSSPGVSWRLAGSSLFGRATPRAGDSRGGGPVPARGPWAGGRDGGRRLGSRRAGCTPGRCVPARRCVIPAPAIGAGMVPPPLRAAMLAAAIRSRWPWCPQCGQRKSRPAGFGTRRAQQGQVEEVPRSSTAGR